VKTVIHQMELKLHLNQVLLYSRRLLGKETLVLSKKVAVAMSGGVDSSVAALLLKQKGYQVFGITMDILPGDAIYDQENITVKDARKVAAQLGIPHYVTDLRQPFSDYVIDGFCDEYFRGRTPNPCIVCNQHIKFGFLMRTALDLGADFLATGHYVRIGKDNGEFLLYSGLDSSKDQSYFLYTLGQEQLAHTMFPLGDLHKEKVREIAIASGLLVANKTESQEICFVSRGRYEDFVESCRPDVPKTGEFRFSDGKVLGMHHGVHRYTIGQRKGLGIAFGEPIFVTRIDPETATVWLGRFDELYSSSLLADEVRYISGQSFSEPIHLTAKIRSAAPKVEALVSSLGDTRMRVEFFEPQRAITPGQSVVVYNGDQVLAGGTIIEAGE